MPVGLLIWQLREHQRMGIIQAIFLFLRAFILGRAAELCVMTFCSFLHEFSSAPPASSGNPLMDG
jgi:hypothetical protein